MYFNRLWISHKVSWVGWPHRLAYLMETSDVCTMNYGKVPLLGGLTEIGHVALVADTETNILVPYTETEILSYQRNFATRSCHNAASGQNVNIMTFMLNGSIIVSRHYKNREEENIQVRHYWPFCEGNPSITDGFPSQRASNAESVSMAWRLIYGIYCVKHWNGYVFWRNLRQWLHWKLSKWQFPVLPVMKL